MLYTYPHRASATFGFAGLMLYQLRSFTGFRQRVSANLPRFF